MRKLIVITLVFGAALFIGKSVVFAEANINEEISVLNDAISNKKGSLNSIDGRIDNVEKEIGVLKQKSRSLANETALLENRIEKTNLDMEANELETGTILDEINVLDLEIDQMTSERERERLSIVRTIREINIADQRNKIHLIFSTTSFSEFFDKIRFFENLNSQLKDAIVRTTKIRDRLEGQRFEKEGKLSKMQDLAETLILKKLQLAEEEGAKSILLSQTRASESSFHQLIRDLEQEQAFIQSQIFNIQNDIDAKLRDEDTGGGSLSALSWPLGSSKGIITALFHDVTYPFRNLWEHSGLDIAAPSGSPVYSPAPGYVAWTKQGRLYGNYMMVIHADGIATLYAHLSAFEAVADQFVARGEIIGRIGTTGFSTGPHLHFEVRKNGIPTDPLSYVITP